MIIDYKLILFNNTATGTSVTSKVLELSADKNLEPLFLNVKLTKGKASAVTSIKVQSSADAAFGTPVDEVTYTIPAAVDQANPCNLLQTFCPISYGNKYVRLVAAGAAGGELFATISPDIQVPIN